MHLTNYAINKGSESFIPPGVGPSRTAASSSSPPPRTTRAEGGPSTPTGGDDDASAEETVGVTVTLTRTLNPKPSIAVMLYVCAVGLFTVSFTKQPTPVEDTARILRRILTACSVSSQL